jgi:hypothetical protein
MSKHISGRYLAGLWEYRLENNLLWTASLSGSVDDGEQRIAVLDNYAPTWSCASVVGPIWFVNFTGNPVYQDMWCIQGVDFKTTTSNKFGPGEGTISMDAFVLPLTISDDGYFVCPVAERIHLLFAHYTFLVF